MMKNIHCFARRRPLSSLTATTALTTLGYASYVEYTAGKSKTLQSIPRDRYDADAIANYWSERPISGLKRLLSIGTELAPVAGEYLYKFHLRPRIHNKLNISSNADECTTKDTSTRCESVVAQDGEANSIFANLSSIGNTTTRSNDRQSTNEERQLSQKLRKALTNLGPTFIKCGQQISIRPDLVSPTVLQELQRLCDAVPPFDDELALQVLAEELQSKMTDNESRRNNDVLEEMFESRPKLVAAASLGQVYKAKLRFSSDDTGTYDVAIKIQRPDILSTVTLDLFLLVTYGKIVDRICSIVTNQVPYHENFLNGFSQGAYMELNYENEAANQMYFRKELHDRFNSGGDRFSLNFLRNSNKRVEQVIVPKVHEQYTTQRVLISEWIDGTPLAQAPPEEIRQLIPTGVALFLCQLLDIGRFHADPHPVGCIFVVCCFRTVCTMAQLVRSLLPHQRETYT